MFRPEFLLRNTGFEILAAGGAVCHCHYCFFFCLSHLILSKRKLKTLKTFIMGVIDAIVLAIRILFYIGYCYVEAFVHLFKPPTRKSIAGEIVLVTGAGHGIGRQLAIDLSKLGATVVVWDVNKETNDNTAEEINTAGGKAFAYVCDVTSISQIAEVADKVRQEVGEVSILVNNAGVLNGAYLTDLDEKLIRRTFEINTLSHFWMNKQFLPSMMKKNHGHIFNVASIAGFMGAPALTDYCCSKFAARGLGEALSIELSQQGYTGINVSTLCPFVVDTGMLKNYHCSLAPTLTPEEVSRVAVDGLLRNYPLIIVPEASYYTTKLSSLLPAKASTFAYKFGLLKVMPQLKKDN